MAKKYRTLSALKKEIKKQVVKGLENKVSEVVKDEQVTQIDDIVYDAYEPKEYDRRYDKGGLKDKDNMRVDMLNTDEGVNMMITNQTRGHPEYGDEELFISPIVEYGHGSRWGVYDYAKTGREPYAVPRRFQKVTIAELKRNKKHVEELKEHLRRSGFKVK